MINQVEKFIPQLTDMNEPLRQLLHKDKEWIWGEEQELAFKKLKDALIAPSVLAHYSTKREQILQTDTSNTGISVVLLQVQDDGMRRPVCFASRLLSDAKKRYAVIKK